MSELEELAREEFSRLKKVKEKKRGKKKREERVEEHVCPMCVRKTEKEKVKEKVKEKEKVKVVSIEEQKGSEGYVLEAKETESKPPTPLLPVLPPAPAADVTSSYRSLPPPATTTQISGGDVVTRLDFVKQRLVDIITISKTFVDAGIDSFDVNEFLIICEGAKTKIESIFASGPLPCSLDDDLKSKLENLKTNLREVVDVTKDFKNEGLVSPSIENFIKACEVIDSKINQPEPKPIDSQSRVYELTAHLDDIMRMTQNYATEGLLTPGVGEFLRSCNIVKAKIEGKKSGKKDADEEKLDHLKDHVCELEELTAAIEEKKMGSSSVEKFITACKNFKTKIDQDIEKIQTKRAINELSEHIDEVIEVGKEAQKDGLLRESMEDFIKCIGDVKKRINPEGENSEKDQESIVLDALKVQINNIIESATKMKSANLMSTSIDDLLKSCELAKTKIEFYLKYPPINLEEEMVDPTCSKTCVCEPESTSTMQECEKCKEINKTASSGMDSGLCNFCQDRLKGKEPSEEAPMCGTCSRPYEEDILLPEVTPNISPEESDICEICEMLKKQLEPEPEPEPETKAENKPEPQAQTPTAVDSSLGYFEKKIRKITKVTRSLNPDGTIREERETITIKHKKHDPNETTLDDDENDEYDVSCDSLGDEDGKQVAVCSTPTQNQRGFLNLTKKAKSEITFRASPIATPILKHCISHGCFNVKDNNFLLSNDSFSVEMDYWHLQSNSNIMERNSCNQTTP